MGLRHRGHPRRIGLDAAQNPPPWPPGRDHHLEQLDRPLDPDSPPPEATTLPVEITPKTEGLEPRRATNAARVEIQQGHPHLHKGLEHLSRIVGNSGEEPITTRALANPAGEFRHLMPAVVELEAA